MIENHNCKNKCWHGTPGVLLRCGSISYMAFAFNAFFYYCYNLAAVLHSIKFFFGFSSRMGSFNSAPKIQNADTQDDYVDVPNGLASSGELVNHCRVMRGENRPDLLNRSFYKASTGLVSEDVTDGLRLLELNSISKGESIVLVTFCSTAFVRNAGCGLFQQN